MSTSDIEAKLDEMVLSAIMHGLKQAGTILGTVIQSEIAAGTVREEEGTLLLERTLAVLAGVMADVSAEAKAEAAARSSS